MPAIASKAEEVLGAIRQWEHWKTIQKGAIKEYGITEAEFQAGSLRVSEVQQLSVSDSWEPRN